MKTEGRLLGVDGYKQGKKGWGKKKNICKNKIR